MTNFDDKPTLSLAKPVKIKGGYSGYARLKSAPCVTRCAISVRGLAENLVENLVAGMMARKALSLERVPNPPANRMAAYEVASLAVLHDHYLDGLSENKRLEGLYPSDRQFVRLLVTSLLRHHRQLSELLDGYLQRTPPADAMLILMMGAAHAIEDTHTCRP